MPNPKQVKGLLLNSSDDRMGVVLNWLQLTENIADYEVYRVGAVVAAELDPPYNIQITDDLQLKVRGGKTQTITFPNITAGAATAQEVIDDINAQADGVEAFLSGNGASFYLRVTSGTTLSRSLEIVGGTAQPVFQLPLGKYTHKRKSQVYQRIATVTDPVITFEDRDGDPKDLYFVRGIGPLPDSLVGQDSVRKQLKRHYDELPNRVVIWGNIYDMSGVPMEELKVCIATPQGDIPGVDGSTIGGSTFGISKDFATAFTDEDGFFEIEVVSNTNLRLRIPSINYDRNVRTGDTSQNFLKLADARGKGFFF